jgi:hypothetical protein
MYFKFWFLNFFVALFPHSCVWSMQPQPAPADQPDVSSDELIVYQDQADIMRFLHEQISCEEALRIVSSCIEKEKSFIYAAMTGKLKVARVLKQLTPPPDKKILRKIALFLISLGNALDPVTREKSDQDIPLLSPLVKILLRQADNREQALIAELELYAVLGDLNAVRGILYPNARWWQTYGTHYFWGPPATGEVLKLINSSSALLLAAGQGNIGVVEFLVSIGSPFPFANPFQARQRIKDLLEFDKERTGIRIIPYLVIQRLLDNVADQWGAILRVARVAVVAARPPSPSAAPSPLMRDSV